MIVTLERRRVGGLTCIAVVVILALLGAACSGDPEEGKRSYLESGKAYLDEGKYAEASIEFRNALKIDARFVDGYYYLAQAQVGLREWVNAYRSLQQAKDLAPERTDVRIALGRLLMVAGQLPEAEDEARFVLESEPDNPPALQLLAASLAGRQQYEEALEIFNRLVELAPEEPANYANRSLAEMALGRVGDAEKSLQTAVTVDPNYVDGYEKLSTFYRMQRNLARAEQVLEDGVEKNSDAAVLYINWAALLYGQNKADAGNAVLARLREQRGDSAEVVTAIGDFYLLRGDASGAEQEYRAALQIEPDSVRAKQRLIDLYLDTHQVEAAEKLNQEVLKENPAHIPARVAYGRILMEKGETDEAITALQREVAEAPDSAIAQYFLGVAFRRRGDLAQAKTHLQEAQKFAPERLPVLNSLAELALTQGDARVAQEYAARAVQQNPGDVQARILLGNSLHQQNRFREAEQQLEFARGVAPDNAMVHLELARLYVSMKRWQSAEQNFEATLRLDPNMTMALAQLAKVMSDRNQRSRAIARVQSHIAQHPGQAQPYVVLGTLQFEGGDFGTAEQNLEKAIRLDPNMVQAYLQLGNMYQQRGNLPSAIQRFEKALAIQPAMVPLRVMVGNLYLTEGNLEAAQKYFERALEDDPNFPVALGNLAWVQAERGLDLNVALSNAQRAKELLPEAVSITDTIGWIYHKKGNYPAALPLFEECVSKDPENAVYRYHYGMALISLGDTEKGKAELRAALERNLRESDARQARETLAAVN